MQDTKATDVLLGKEELIKILMDKGFTRERAEAAYPEIANNFVTMFLTNAYMSLNENDKMMVSSGVGDLDTDEKIFKMREKIFTFMKANRDKFDIPSLLEDTREKLGNVIIELISK